MFIGTFAGVWGRKSPLFLGDIRSTSEKSIRFDLQRGLLSCLVMTELGRVGWCGLRMILVFFFFGGGADLNHDHHDEQGQRWMR